MEHVTETVDAICRYIEIDGFEVSDGTRAYITAQLRTLMTLAELDNRIRTIDECIKKAEAVS